MPRHIYFVAPESTLPIGGVNLMYWFAEILCENGYSASVHYVSPDYVYPYCQSNVPCTYSPRREEMPALRHLPSVLLTRWRKSRRTVRRKGANRLSVPGAEDILVLPEYAAAKLLPKFPGVPALVLAQDVHDSIRGTLVPLAGNKSGKSGVLGYVTTSKAADKIVAMFSDAPRRFVPQVLESGVFSFVAQKKKQVVYMNRKRPEEVAVLRTFLRRDLAERGFGLVEIDRVPNRSELMSIVAESLFFVSLSRQEGFGLPPAEAMAMGCIAVGYTGVGGNEYFTSDVGFPVPDDDIAALYQKVLELVDTYRRDPAPLDELRRKASERVLDAYRKENTSRALLKAFEELVN